MRKILLICGIIIFTLQSKAQETAQWRGDNRDGKYADTGLLKQWTAEGPKLLWHFDELGPGHASAAITKELVYTAGTSAEGQGFVIALTHTGEKVWKTEFGKEWIENWEGVRSTPLIYDNKVYIESSYGKLVCLNAKDGKIIWNIDFFTEYDGVNIKWGVTENLIADGNMLICTPGGKNANIIALDINTGKLIWKSSAKGELSAYCSPAIIKVNDRKILVTQTANSILGIELASGKLLWSHTHENKWSVQANTPLFYNGDLYCVSGYGKGGVMLKVSEDGNSVTEKWTNTSLDSKMGGVILFEGKIYGSGDKNKQWVCLDWETGKELYSSKMMKEGNVIFADGLLYCYDTNGKIGIVDPKTNNYELISSFDVPYGEKYHWAHLVINDKKLYVRHGTSLMVYDIAQK